MANRRSKDKPVKLPIIGKAVHNNTFQSAIGGLVIAWSNNESVFLAILQALVGGSVYSAAIVWHSIRTTNARLDLISKLCREQIKDTEIISELDASIKAFKNLSSARNFYCHATYEYDADLFLISATGVTLNQESHPININKKRLERAVINEITHATLELARMNAGTWKLVARIDVALGERRVYVLNCEAKASPHNCSIIPNLGPKGPHPGIHHFRCD